MIDCATKAEAEELMRVAAKANGLPLAGEGIHCPGKGCKSTSAEHVFGKRALDCSHLPLLRCLECGAEFPAIGWVVYVDGDDSEIDDAAPRVSAEGLVESAKLSTAELATVSAAKSGPFKDDGKGGAVVAEEIKP